MSMNPTCFNPTGNRPWQATSRSCWSQDRHRGAAVAATYHAATAEEFLHRSRQRRSGHDQRRCAAGAGDDFSEQGLADRERRPARRRHEHAALARLDRCCDPSDAHNAGLRHHRPQPRCARTRSGLPHDHPGRPSGLRRDDSGKHPAAIERQNAGIVLGNGPYAATLGYSNRRGLHRRRYNRQEGRSCHRRDDASDVVAGDGDWPLSGRRPTDPRYGRNSSRSDHAVGAQMGRRNDSARASCAVGRDLRPFLGGSGGGAAHPWSDARQSPVSGAAPASGNAQSGICLRDFLETSRTRDAATRANARNSHFLCNKLS